MSTHDHDNAVFADAPPETGAPVRPLAGASRPRRAGKSRQIIQSRRVIHHRRRK